MILNYIITLYNIIWYNIKWYHIISCYMRTYIYIHRCYCAAYDSHGVAMVLYVGTWCCCLVFTFLVIVAVVIAVVVVVMAVMTLFVDELRLYYIVAALPLRITCISCHSSWRLNSKFMQLFGRASVLCKQSKESSWICAVYLQYLWKWYLQKNRQSVSLTAEYWFKKKTVPDNMKENCVFHRNWSDEIKCICSYLLFLLQPRLPKKVTKVALALNRSHWGAKLSDSLSHTVLGVASGCLVRSPTNDMSLTLQDMRFYFEPCACFRFEKYALPDKQFDFSSQIIA